jgi:hypothetical protein
MVDRAKGAGGARSSEDPGSTDSSTQVASATETVSAEAADPAADPHHMIEKIKRILESRKKMLLAAALDHAQHVAVNDHYLMVGYDPSDAGRHYKAQIEDARRIVEEACYEALGKRLTLSVSLGGLISPRQGPGSSTLPRPDPKANDITPENHPAVRAIIERFNGEIIDVDVPDR